MRLAAQAERRRAGRLGGLESDVAAGLSAVPGMRPRRDLLSEYLAIDQVLAARDSDYQEMSSYSDISLALDVYADEATIPADDGRTVWVESKDKELADGLNYLLHKQLRFDDDVWALMRELAKRGNNYAEAILHPENGLVKLAWMPPPSVRRLESDKGVLMGFAHNPNGFQSFQYGEALRQLSSPDGKREVGQTQLFDDWEVIHWRIRGESLTAMYGTALLEAARWPWKRLKLLEDGAVLYKLTRSPARYVFKVEVGNTEPTRIWHYIEQVADRFKRKKYVDSSGKIRVAQNVLAPDEDLVLPVKGGSPLVDVDLLSGTDYQDMSPVDYFQAKTYAALKMPKMRIGSTEDVRKDVLISQDVGFARMTMRNQRALKQGVVDCMNLHLRTIGVDPDRADYEVKMQMSSQIFELSRMEVLSARADLMQRWQAFASPKWILVNIGRMSESDAETVWSGFMASRKEQAKADGENMRLTQPGMESLAWGQSGDERQFTAGNREHEKRLTEKLDDMRSLDGRMDTRLKRVEVMLSELRSTVVRNGGRRELRPVVEAEGKKP